MVTTTTAAVTFRTVTAAEVATCAALEAASYPADEAASPEGLSYRQAEAGDYFRCAVRVNPDTGDDDIVGYVCGTRCATFTHESMASHDPTGRLLAIHSVVVREDTRRQGLARQMLQEYLAHVASRKNNKITHAPLDKVVLIAKAHLLGFYVQCGLTVTRISPIVHGKSFWYELEQQLVLPALSPHCFVVDSFGSPARRGTGNPAAVVLLDQAPVLPTDNEWMQSVAAEFNLSETAFVWPVQQQQQRYGIRFFTPTVPVALCGHATLAAASILYQTDRVPLDETVTLEASQDVLQATCVDEDASRIRMVLPAQPAVALAGSDRSSALTMLRDAFGLEAEQITWLGLAPAIGDLLVQVASTDWLRALETETINFNVLCTTTTALPSYTRGVILSSLGAGANLDDDTSSSTDPHFVSRFFAPKAGIPEDPVTGSAHAILAPHYAHLASRAAKGNYLRAEQWSSRGGWLTCRMLGTNQVEISGRVAMTLEGRLK
jgi:PhzF family phenazine biosynthesis protein